MQIPDMMFWSDLSKFLKGIQFSDEKRRKLAARIGEKNYSDFAERIIRILYQNDTMRKNQYYINLTWCLFEECIEIEDYYRGLNAIKSTLYEDLQYLIKNVDKNISIDSIMGSDVNKYHFTPLAKLIDQYSLSYGRKNYRYNGNISNLNAESIFGTKTGSEWNHF